MGSDVQFRGGNFNNNCVNFFPISGSKLFGEEAVFSLAAAIGKPLQVDMATKNKS